MVTSPPAGRRVALAGTAFLIERSGVQLSVADPMLERRRIEATILEHVYDTLMESRREEAAKRAIADAHRSSGRGQLTATRGEMSPSANLHADRHRPPGSVAHGERAPHDDAS